MMTMQPALEDALDYAEVLHMFAVESSECLHAMEEAILTLETQPWDGEALQTIFRVAHTLKGNAASLGLNELAQFAHSLEDVLDRLRTGVIPVSDEVIALLLESKDALAELVPRREARE